VRDGRGLRDGRGALLLLALLVVGVIGIGLVRERSGRQAAQAAADSPADDANFVDEDGDGEPDPLPVRRLAASPAGHVVLDALHAMGGWAPYARHEATAWRVEGAFFDPRGVLVGSRSERGVATRQGAPRLHVTSEDGTEQFGLGDVGPWGGARGDNGLWDPAAGPGALPPAEVARLAWESVWFARVPFNLGDVEVTLVSLAAAPGDSLERISATYPPAPADTVSRRYELGFDPSTGLLREVRQALDGDSTAARIVVFDDWRDVDGLRLPHRRKLYGTDPDGLRVLEFDILFTELAPADSIAPETFRAPVDR
jgi:hypothetical protein